MPLTEEQRGVVEADDPILKVNAVAGSGKTTTLLEYAAHRPHRKILYLAYNKSVAEEVREKAGRRGLENFTASTIHSLAYRHAGGRNYTLESDLSEWRILDEYLPIPDRASEEALLLAWLIKDLVNYYLNSALTGLDIDLLCAYITATSPGEALQDLLAPRGEEILGLVRTILSDMKNRQLPALHDFYLKMFQFTKTRLPYDIVLVDEAQDTSGVMLSIIGRQEHAQQVFVGDSFQQIYAFRHAVNSLEHIEGASRWLSQTFRFGNNLAQHLTEQINDAYRIITGKTQAFHMRGTQADTRFDKRAYKNKFPLTFIARSNMALFEAVVDWLLRTTRSMYFEGGYASYAFMNARVVSLISLKEYKRTQITDPFIKKFRHFEDVKRFAKNTQNQSLWFMADLVSRYGSQLYEFDRMIKARLTGKLEAHLIFTTTHRAKGQEYDYVEMVEDDFATRKDLGKLLKSGQDEVNLVKLREEINVYYVAATRARQSIRLASF